ncbi:MAG: acyl-CoA thioesterase [Myxococcales bacterium]|nr:acyl-CoA thioesterase [Myxococcales bacterium]
MAESLAPRVVEPVSVPIQLRFSDTDMMGHINNGAFASYTEIGRIAFLNKYGSENPGVVLARLAFDFKREVHLGDEVVLTTQCARLGRTSVTFEQVVHANGEVAVIGEAVVVFIDLASRKPVQRPQHWSLPA